MAHQRPTTELGKRWGLVSAASLIAALGLAQCGTTVYDPGGTGNYANNTNWTVTYCPVVGGQVVTMTLTAFNTELNFDFLTVYNGPTTASPVIGTFSGTTIPGPFTSTAPGGCLTLRFTSDISQVRAGWVANITCGLPPPPPVVCGTTVYDPGGSGGNYANNANWTTTYCPTVVGQAVTINFTAFNIEASYDFLTIYDGPNTGAPSLGTFTGTGLPGSITSSSPDGCLTLRFTSDGSFTFAGWVANITCAVPPPPPTGDCVLALRLSDEFGDGWGTSFVGVSINGGPFQNYTVTGSFTQILIGVDIGDLIVLNYDNSGAFQEDNSYMLGLQSVPCPYLFASGTPPAAGISFVHTVNCNVPSSAQEDCEGGFTVCGDAMISNSAQSTGCVDDLIAGNTGCLAAFEQRGTWYYFSPSQSGTVGFTLTPMDGGAPAPVDYDFAIWGPMSAPTCPPAGPPTRCSFAYPPSAGTYLTGMGNGAADVSEAAAGAGVNGFVAPMNVVAGQVYVMYIDNFDEGSEAFNLDWSLTNGASLDCTVLPVELLSFHAVPRDGSVHLDWTTVMEQNSSHFIVERSMDGISFTALGETSASGASVSMIDYAWIDADPRNGSNHYRLKQVDLDGSVRYSSVESVVMGREDEVLVIPNPVGAEAQVSLKEAWGTSLSYRITDAAGRVVQERAMAVPEGVKQFTITMDKAEAGAYFLVILDGTGLVHGHTRFVKH